jgi:hypothetical protein
MTNKEFVQKIYPDAYFTRGSIFTKDNNILLWEDEYGVWAEEWNDPLGIENAWSKLAAIINLRMLQKLES